MDYTILFRKEGETGVTLCDIFDDAELWNLIQKEGWKIIW